MSSTKFFYSVESGDGNRSFIVLPTFFPVYMATIDGRILASSASPVLTNCVNRINTVLGGSIPYQNVHKGLNRVNSNGDDEKLDHYETKVGMSLVRFERIFLDMHQLTDRP